MIETANHDEQNKGWSRALAALSTLLLSLIWTHAVAAMIRSSLGIAFVELAPTSAALTWGALCVGLFATRRTSSQKRDLSVSAGVASATALFIGSRYPAAQLAAWALLPVALAASGLHRFTAPRIPAGLVAVLTARRWRKIAWVLVSILAVVQVARLTTYVSNPKTDWFLTTGHPFYAKHECSNAYFYAAELHDRGEPDIYDPAHYPGLNPEAKPHTEMVGMAPEDPFQYPPPFLMLPAFARSLSHDYAAIRSVWFALNLSFCLGAVVLLGAWIGRRSTWKPLALAPLVAVAFPVLHNFQYGQFHFATVALATLGLLFLHQQKRIAGGALLGAAISAKLFPLWALALLFGQKRYRDIVATLGFTGFYFLLGWLTLGPSPYLAFFGEHTARLSNGSAFAFGQAWPEVADLVTAGNQGVAGIVGKAQALGLSFLDSTWAARAATLYSVALLPALYLTGTNLEGADRGRLAAVWMGAIGLASLASAGAWADYVPLTGVWLAVILLPLLDRKKSLRWTVVGAAFLQMTLIGTMPLGSFSEGAWLIPLSLISALGLFSLFVLGVRRSTFGAVAGWQKEDLLLGPDKSLPPASQPSPSY